MAVGTIKKLGGGSKGLRINPYVLEEMGLDLDDQVHYRVKGKKIIIEKIEKEG